jgi:hypothetical protein
LRPYDVRGERQRGSARGQMQDVSPVGKFLSDKVIRMEEGIRAARQRLTGNFREQSEYDDTRRALEQLVADLPALRSKCAAAQSTYSKCKAWLDGLPDDMLLEPADTKVRGTLDEVRRQIAALESERDAIANALDRSDVERKIADYVHGLAKPTITGLGKGQKLKCLWPGCGWDQRGPLEHHAETLPMLAMLFPNEMVAALTGMVKVDERPPYERAKRTAIIDRNLEELRYVEESLVQATGAERSPSAPAQAILQVRFAREVMAADRERKVTERRRETVA